MTAAVLVLSGCSVAESSRNGGLLPPTGPAATSGPPSSTVVTTDPDGDLAIAVSPTSGASGETSLAVSQTSETSSGGTSAGSPASDTETPASAGPGSFAQTLGVLDAAEPPEGFGEGVLGVTGSAGTQVWPVLIADTPQAHRRGLMGVDDFSALGGYAAMVFIFEEDTSGAFWMRDTPLPLHITFVTAGGSVVSAADMAPCLPPTPSGECERYHPDGPYRIAIEHPLGPAFDIGLTAADLVEVTVEQ